MTESKMKLAVNSITAFALLVSFLFPAIYYPKLSEQIPIHFNAIGKADNFGPKDMVWLVPVVEFLLCLGLFRLQQYFYKKGNKTKNVELLAACAVSKSLCFLIAVSFTYITVQTVLVALKISDGLGVWFLPVFVFASIGLPLLTLIKLRKTKKTTGKV